jgi:hypothetical protein
MSSEFNLSCLVAKYISKFILVRRTLMTLKSYFGDTVAGVLCYCENAIL